MLKYLDRYVITANLLLLLAVLSPAFTRFYTENQFSYLWLAILFAVSIFIFEYIFNQAGYSKKEKAKKVYYCIMPVHLVIFTITVFALF